MGRLVIGVAVMVLTIAAASGNTKSPSAEFNKHKVVQPIAHHSRTKREIQSTRETDGTHHPEVLITVPVDGEDYLLDLRLNKVLVAEGHTLQYQAGGKTIQHVPTLEELDLCHYYGSVRGKPASWAAVSTCRGVSGAIFDGERMLYIEPVDGTEIQSPHYLYDYNDVTSEHKCGHSSEITNSTVYDPELLDRHRRQAVKSQITRHKRSTARSGLQVPFNDNTQSRYIELVLVADNKEFQQSKNDMRIVHSQLIHVANIINSLYAPLNIFVALVGVVVWSEQDEIQLNENGDITLTNFLAYRKKKLVYELPNDNAHLITRQIFSGGVIGKALKGPMCSVLFSGGVVTKTSDVLSQLANSIAHGIGHNFGMEHDIENCTCPEENCIMRTTFTPGLPVHWSSCSLESLQLAFSRGIDYCLRNKPKHIFQLPTCGNGFIEPGEQCDCGITAGGGVNPCHACCHPDTCMLRSNATCSAGACCDFTKCRPKSAGEVCRSADRECDLPEYCTGHSEFCPQDVYKMDSTPCGTTSNEAYCMRGACATHTDQCRLLWGSTGEDAAEICYTTNRKGNRNGNCGYDSIGQTFKPCAASDILCGMVQCRHLNEQLEFGIESVSLLSVTFIAKNGTVHPCRTAIIDLGINDVDPGLVPDGAKCGDDHMCLKQRCVSISAVREAMALRDSSVCPSNCSGHGVCNSEGHCHCDSGFAPPLCAAPGPGGSVDSGPASDPSGIEF